MSSLPITQCCYHRRIAELQAEIQSLLVTMQDRCCSPEAVERLDQQMQPLYAAIWAMHAETDL